MANNINIKDASGATVIMKSLDTGGGVQVPAHTVAPVTSGGLTKYHSVLSSTAPAVVVKASEGQLYHIKVENTGSSAVVVHFYDTATTPTIGSGTVVWSTLAPPTNSGEVEHIPEGLPFTTGIAYTLPIRLTQTPTRGSVFLDRV